MRKCEEISRLGGAKDDGKETPRGRGGSSFFAFVVVVICFLVGFLFLFVSLLLYFFCAVIIAKELFEGRLALNPRLNLTQVSFSCVQKHFLG